MSHRTPKALTQDEVAELWALFGPPPVLSTENQKAYDTIRAEYVALYRPWNTLQVRAIREVVDQDWEIFRFTRHRTLGIDRRFRNQVENQALRARIQNAQNKEQAQHLAKYQPGDIAQLAQLQAVIEETESDVEKILTRQPDERAHNLALEQGAAFMDQLDKWLNSATARRNAARQFLDYCCDRPHDKDEVIDADYEEVQNRQLEQKPSPSLAPEVIANDVAAQNSSKPVERPQN